jgi:FKBP-type peptidyl-prolyl cis-trans isomerase SlyD
MKISPNLVASIHYTLKNDDGEILDSSVDQEPMNFLCGADNIVPGLEKALEGKVSGDKLSVVVEPNDGYGEYDATLVQELSKDMFAGVESIEVGMEFQTQTPDGMQVIEVKKIEGDTVTIDGNHPMAGHNLHFDIEITDVREATADELEHGHVHGEGCSH